MALGPDSLTVRVRRKTLEADRILAFELVAADGGSLPPFAAGAHVEVQTPGGQTRHYSLCNAPHDLGHYQIAVLLEADGRGGSAAIHRQLHEDDLLQISRPRNHFPLHEDAAHSLLLAGGIGITPLLAMAERLHFLGRSFSLHYTTRNAERRAFATRLRMAPFARRVHFYQSGSDASENLDLARVLKSAPPGTHVYVCGPKRFLDAARVQAREEGWPEERVHFEYFGGAESHAVGDKPFDVVLQSTGAVVRVGADQTVVEALADHGICIGTSCEEGVCGTCLTRVLEGEIDHRDLYLTREEQSANDQFLPCCSRSHSHRLVLDL